ncbi:DNA repair protein [Pontibacter qinzhouensis]|uniref:DNA repair protein n=1 Tax=Pontibacter qinzhouensis TaxID=2603253 RepID=A0A5C8J7M3_9BACT|nr:CRISPR-associated endonuclease Cas6 [Pontibacter qinzhouensis]TXK33286.1 DNA repair protein [Pontibacter qinzhouensis]
MQQTIHTTAITFPEIQLQTRDAHKLRGYFGNLFREHSPLLHNHLESGQSQYRYPLVQYKVTGKTPMLLGLNEGAELLTSLFLKVQELQLDGLTYPVLSKNIRNQRWKIGVDSDLHHYRYETLWMGLNQDNHQRYMQTEPGQERQEQLKRIAISNILAFYKAFDLLLPKEQRIMLSLQVQEKSTRFKDQHMLAFSGGFTTNALLPDFVGLGKSVARGFGTVCRV